MLAVYPTASAVQDKTSFRNGRQQRYGRLLLPRRGRERVYGRHPEELCHQHFAFFVLPLEVTPTLEALREPPIIDALKFKESGMTHVGFSRAEDVQTLD